MDRPSSLPLAAEERLMLLVGRTAQLSVEIEHVMRRLWIQLVDSDVAQLAVPSGNRDVRDGISRMIERLERLSDAERTAILAAVKRAGQAQERRNIVVHQRWVHDEQDGTWTPATTSSRTGAKPAWKEQEFESILADLNVSVIRLASTIALVDLARDKIPPTVTLSDERLCYLRDKLLALVSPDTPSGDLEGLENLRRTLLGRQQRS